MTDKLYYTQAHLFECDATVEECTPCDDGFDVVLDKTVIFPEGGGQPCDFGYIDGAFASYSYEKDGKVYHRTTKKFSVGAKVKVKTDERRRLENSQQHTGEHIISGIAMRLHKSVNVGFHMGVDYSTLDLDVLLTQEQIDELEALANDAVYANIPITYEVVDASELERFTLRKKTAGLSGTVRIVFIGDVDSCTCCGTHCEATGEVGLIKITSWQKYKSGVRIWFSCGIRALNDFKTQQDALETLARRFSVKRDMVIDAVKHQGDELNAQKRTLKLRTETLMEYKAASLCAEADTINGVTVLVHSEHDLDMKELKLLCEKLVAVSKKIACVLFSTCGDTLYYQIACSNGVSPDLGCLTSAVNAAVNGKGGGRELYAQGSAKLPSGMEQTEKQLLTYLKTAIH